MSDVKIMAIVGSLRTGSVNAAVARAAVASAADGVAIDRFDVTELPFYHGDVEEAGLPESVQALHEAVGAADGLMIFTPEYNSSFPAVTKNAIDWMTRPPKAWEGKAVTMVVATPGGRAGLGVRSHFETVTEHINIRVMPALGIGKYFDKLTDGEVTDADTLNEIADHVASFADFCTAG